MRVRYGSGGVQEPDMKLSWRPWDWRCVVKAVLSSGVMGRSPSDAASKGLGSEEVKRADVGGSVKAQVRSRFGNVTRRRTEAL